MDTVSDTLLFINFNGALKGAWMFPVIFLVAAGSALLLSACSSCNSESPEPSAEPPIRPEPTAGHLDLDIEEAHLIRAYRDLHRLGVPDSRFDRGFVFSQGFQVSERFLGSDGTISGAEVVCTAMECSAENPRNPGFQSVVSFIREQEIPHPLAFSLSSCAVPSVRAAHLPEAMELYESVTRSPETAESHDAYDSLVALGLLNWETGNPMQAETYLREAAERFPIEPEGPRELATFLLSVGRTEEAEQWSEESSYRMENYLRTHGLED